MKKAISILALAAAFLCLTTACTKTTYDTTGTISGFIQSYNTGEPLNLVLVTIAPTNRNNYSGMDGSYQFNNVDPGEYRISFQKAGYKSNTKDITVNAGETMILNLVMEVEPSPVK
ncbi:MAG: carboxypeptidase regulatory-like domain-containing protein [Bacteroidales bacterium]|nr:carboxypeptidase regulatory-like domain-containing protein [Bacteroidales bacterium]